MPERSALVGYSKKHEKPHVREDPLYAAGLVKAVISSCIAPALAEHTRANPTDEAAYRPFLTAWPRFAPVTREALYAAAVAETREWLSLPETKRAVRRLAEKLFVYRHELLQGELLQRILVKVTEQPATPTTAVRPAPPAAPARTPKTGLDIQL